MTAATLMTYLPMVLSAVSLLLHLRPSAGGGSAPTVTPVPTTPAPTLPSAAATPAVPASHPILDFLSQVETALLGAPAPAVPATPQARPIIAFLGQLLPVLAAAAQQPQVAVSKPVVAAPIPTPPAAVASGS